MDSENLVEEESKRLGRKPLVRKKIVIEWVQKDGEAPKITFTFKNVNGYVEASKMLRQCDQRARKHRAYAIPLDQPLESRGAAAASGNVTEK